MIYKENKVKMTKIKVLTTALLFVLIGNIKAQNVNIPDANFKNYLVNNSSINTNSDAEIQITEAQNYGGIINCNNLDISDLTGIEYFTNIIALFCMNNQLENLNLSSNTLLTNIRCSGNQLSSLDLSSNTNLSIVLCENNQLNNLTLPSGTNLQKIFFSNNLLDNLDISSSTGLTEVRIDSNRITTLNTASNTALKTLICNNNLLTSLDISSNPNLFYLNCSNNQLTSLNVANGDNNENMCGNTTHMYANNNPNLECIQHDSGYTPSTNTNWQKDTTASWSENCSALSVNDVNNTEAVSIYPNPTTNFIYIKGINTTKIYSIYNALGEKIAKGNITNNEKINVKNLTNGVYFLKFEEGNTVKFIKE